MIQFLTDLLSKIKGYLMGALALAAAVFAALFFYWKNKAFVDDALLKQEKVNEDLAKDNQVIAQNNQDLKNEEAKRAALEKETPDEASNDDVAKFLNDRK